MPQSIIDKLKQGIVLGTASYLTVLTSQAALLTAQRTAVGLQARRLTASVQLIQALGGGWNASQLPTVQAVTSTR